MGTKERILQIRLIEKLAGCPEYAKFLGIEVGGITAAAAKRKEK